MEDKILFMIYNNEIKFMTSPTADHWKWYQSLGGDEKKYDNLIRGYIENNKIIFFKTNYLYDDEVLDSAKHYGPLIRKHFNKENAEVCCGLERKSNGMMLPSRVITEIEMETYNEVKQQETKEQEQQRKYEEQMKKLQERSTKDDLIEFKNDYQDDNFSKYAVTFTTVILVATLISKIILISSKKLYIDNRWNALLVFVQIISLILSIYLYKKKNSYAKYSSLCATAALFMTFNLSDIIIGAFNFFFTVDQKYIVTFLEQLNKAKNKSEEELNKIKNKTQQKKK